jgi:hypothetical protein
LHFLQALIPIVVFQRFLLFPLPGTSWELKILLVASRRIAAERLKGMGVPILLPNDTLDAMRHSCIYQSGEMTPKYFYRTSGKNSKDAIGAPPSAL